METADHILKCLVCSKCRQLLKRGPVYQQHNGAAVCGPCQARENAQPASRCFLYEVTPKLLRFPCRYREEGCPDTVPFVPAGYTGFTHEDACEYRQYVCPVLGSNRCDWTGRRNQLLQHCQDKHPDRVLSNPSQITPDIRSSQTKDYIIDAFHFLFLLHTRVCVSTGKLHFSMRLLGDPQEAVNHYFHIHRGNDIWFRCYDVLPQEQLALQEHSALNTSTNELLSVMDGASLTVKVKEEPWKEQRRQAEQEREQCVKCGARTPRLYRDKQEQGWLCAGCAPKKWTCDKQGCDFQDIGGEKRTKHSMYFCQRSTSCLVCHEDLQPDTQLHEHYTTCEKIKVIPVSSRFLVRRNNGCEQWFLVKTDAGHVLCWCYYTQYIFTLDVCAPLPCEQLHLHRFKVHLECAGNTRSHTPDTAYDCFYDWKIKCKNDKFFKNDEVHVYLHVCQNY